MEYQITVDFDSEDALLNFGLWLQERGLKAFAESAYNSIEAPESASAFKLSSKPIQPEKKIVWKTKLSTDYEIVVDLNNNRQSISL